MRRLSFIGFSVVAFLTGCSSDPSSGSDSSNATASGGTANAQQTLSAEVTNVAVDQKTNKCDLSVTTIAVKVPDAAVTKKINDALAYNASERLAQYGCTDYAVTITADYKVSYNARGLLSVIYSEYYNAEGAAHPDSDLKTWNFDLTTGDVIGLNDAVDFTALATLVDACKAAPENQGFDNECSLAIAEDPSHVPVYNIELGGLRIHPVDVPHVGWALAEAGGLATWMELNGHMKHPLLKAIAP